MSVTREQIAAFSDGELNGEELAAVEAAVAADPALAREVEAHRALKAQLGKHYAPILDRKVPDRLSEMLSGEQESAEVVSFAKEREKRGLAPALRRWAPYAGPALAASLVLAVLAPWQASELPDGYADAQLAAVLDNTLVATQAPGEDLRVLVSFQNERGEFCRAFHAGAEGGIACRDDIGWDVRYGYVMDDPQTTEFRQAGSEAELFAAAQEMAAGEVLDAAGEAAAKDRGWR